MKYLKKIIRKLLTTVYSFLAKISCGPYVSLQANFYTRLTKNTYLGKNVNFNGCTIYGRGQVKIGDNFHSGKGLKILTEIHDYKGSALAYDDKFIFKETIIEDNVWLGMDVTLLPGITIGEGTIIQAGSVVANDIPKLSIAGGHPAKVFAKRDSDHYWMLKSKAEFH